MHLYAPGLHLGLQYLADHRIELSQQSIFHCKQTDVSTPCVQHAAEFNTDIAAANHRDLAWSFTQVKETIRCDAKFGTRQRRHNGLAAGGNHDVISRVDVL